MIKRKEGEEKKSLYISKIELWVRRHWLYLAIGAFFVLALSVGFLVFALFSNQKDTSNNQNGFSAPTSTRANNGIEARWLDGIKVEPEKTHLLPRAVMIENHVQARPLAGVSKASLVFEAPVEGGITRLMAVYDASTTAAEIGPVRSARPYYVEWARALDAVYAHVGGSPEALNRIGGLISFRNLDEMAGEAYFWRSKYRMAPHNVFISSDRLNRAVTDKKWQAGEFEPWIFIDQDQDFSAGPVREVTIPFDGSYKVKWAYDEESNSYARYVAGSRNKDKDGSKINTKNLLVISTEQRTLDEVGRLFIRTTGQGKGWYFSGGNVKEIVWSRQAGKFYAIKTPDGRDVGFLRGNTWIEIASLPKYEPEY